MLFFQPIRTSRFTVQLQELTNADSRALLNIPSNYIEQGRAEFLRRAIKSIQWHKGFEQNELSDLTVQERLMIEASYLSVVADHPDFALGNGQYSDYLQFDKNYKHAEQKVGLIPGDTADKDIWFIQPMTGLMLEVIEERLLAREEVARIDWLVMAMAAQLYRKQDELPDPKADVVQYGDWLEERAEQMTRLPVSAFNGLFGLFVQGGEMIAHLFDINFDEEGVLVFPKSEYKTNEEGEEYALIPARFHPHSKIDEITKRLLGKSE